MKRFLMLTATLVVVAACGGDGALLEPDTTDGARVKAAKGGKPDKPGGGDPPSAFTLTDLGTGGIRDINDAGTSVGGTLDGASLWKPDGTLVLLTNGTDAAAHAIDEQGTSVVGTIQTGAVQSAVRWHLDASGSVTGSVPLQPLAGDDAANASDTNDNGYAVGQSYPAGNLSAQRATLWDASGTPSYLGDLLGRSGSWARGINNAGHAVGRSGHGSEPSKNPHAVLWIMGATSTTVIDLTPDGSSGDNMAMDITDPDPVGGHVHIAGFSTVDGSKRPTIWTVDIAAAKVVSTLRLEDNGIQANALNEVGQAVLGEAVWNWGTDGSVNDLPGLSRKCFTSARGINNTGIVVGGASVFSQGSCRVLHAVIWTP